MRSILTALVVTLCAASAPAAAHALCEVGTSGSGGPIPRCIGTVETIYVHRDFVRIDIDGDETVLSSQCTPIESRFLSLPLDEPRLSQYLSVLLAAQLSGRTVTVRVGRDAQGNCGVTYIQLSRT